VAVTPSSSWVNADAAHGEFFAQDPLGGILRNRDEAERNVVGQCHVELRRLFSVDVDDLTVHLGRGVEDAAQHSHALEHLERAGLHTNGFRVLGRLEQRVDDATVDAAADEFDGCGQADGTRAGDEDICIGHRVIMLPP
jgi:hypothetical protein